MSLVVAGKRGVGWTGGSMRSWRSKGIEEPEMGCEGPNSLLAGLQGEAALEGEPGLA